MRDSFHVYLNLDVTNNSSENDHQLVFSETRTIPFLSNAEDYFLTVARFNLQTSNNFPIFIPDIQTGQDNFNKTVYRIYMSTLINGVTKQYYYDVDYNPSDLSVAQPSPPTTKVDRSTTYYWIYNINDWVLMLNTAFQNLNNNFISAGILFTTPYIQYDISSGFFNITVDKNAVLTQGLKIYLNPRLYNILPLQSIRIYPNLFDGTDTHIYQLNLPNSLANQTTLLIDGARNDFLTTVTEFCPLSLLNPIRNIFFTTTHLPIQAQLSQSPIVYTDDVPSGVTNNLPDITNVLTDFEISVTAQNSYNGEITYLPVSEYRWLDLNPASSLSKIDVKAYWRDKYGNDYPIYLPPGCSASIKILFRQRSSSRTRILN